MTFRGIFQHLTYWPRHSVKIQQNICSLANSVGALATYYAAVLSTYSLAHFHASRKHDLAYFIANLS